MNEETIRRKLEWSEAMETGDELVDSQHKSMLALLVELLDAENDPKKDEAVPQVLDRLILHTATHFGAEEDLMRASGFPEALLRAHAQQHRELTERTRQLVLDYRMGLVPSIGPVVEFLRTWFEGHIDEMDRLLAEHVRAQGPGA